MPPSATWITSSTPGRRRSETAIELRLPAEHATASGLPPFREARPGRPSRGRSRGRGASRRRGPPPTRRRRGRRGGERRRAEASRASSGMSIAAVDLEREAGARQAGTRLREARRSAESRRPRAGAPSCAPPSSVVAATITTSLSGSTTQAARVPTAAANHRDVDGAWNVRAVDTRSVSRPSIIVAPASRRAFTRCRQRARRAPRPR